MCRRRLRGGRPSGPVRAFIFGFLSSFYACCLRSSSSSSSLRILSGVVCVWLPGRLVGWHVHPTTPPPRPDRRRSSSSSSTTEEAQADAGRPAGSHMVYVCVCVGNEWVPPRLSPLVLHPHTTITTNQRVSHEDDSLHAFRDPK